MLNILHLKYYGKDLQFKEILSVDSDEILSFLE